MTDTELVELAKAYVALSNAHRIDLILPLFATGAVYHSSSLGEFHGQAAIGDMMHGFFAEYADAYWQATRYRCENHQVSFNFSMNATAKGGTTIDGSGVERIGFTADGSIKKVQVESS